jgi:hypothetical protein
MGASTKSPKVRIGQMRETVELVQRDAISGKNQFGYRTIPQSPSQFERLVRRATQCQAEGNRDIANGREYGDRAVFAR